MKKLITAALSLVFMVGLGGFAVAGSLDSPGSPSAGSGMYTLQNLYDYLTSGTALTVQSSFQEPTSGPGSTMKTTKEIGDGIKAKFDMCDVTPDKVLQGAKFFCTQSGSWGVQTGTLVAPPTPTITPTITPTLTPTPTPSPTPTMDMSQVVQIGSMYVAKWTNNAGTDNNATKIWTSACSWGTQLNWLGRSTGWRLPTKDELVTICASKESLGSYQGGDHWSSTNAGALPSCAWYDRFNSCGVNNDQPTTFLNYVRAVRDVN